MPQQCRLIRELLVLRQVSRQAEAEHTVSNAMVIAIVLCCKIKKRLKLEIYFKVGKFAAKKRIASFPSIFAAWALCVAVLGNGHLELPQCVLNKAHEWKGPYDEQVGILPEPALAMT